MGIVADLGDEPKHETPEPKTMVNASSLDPQLFATFREFADALRAGQLLPKYSPLEGAHWSEQLAAAAERQLDKARAAASRDHSAFRRLEGDVEAQIRLGRFFGKLFRVVVLYALYERTGQGDFLDRAILLYRAAGRIYAELAKKMESIYVADLTFGNASYQRGHWSDRLPALARDLAAMERRPEPRSHEPMFDASAVIASIESPPPARPDFGPDHRPPPTFARRRPVSLELNCGNRVVHGVSLHYRILHQAAAWQTLPMTRSRRTFRASIAGTYADGVFPLQYYFSLHAGTGAPQLYPGIGADLADEPYWVLSPAGRS
jgi:hypothetical protein